MCPYDNIGVIMGLYWDNGKENGNDYNGCMCVTLLVVL